MFQARRVVNARSVQKLIRPASTAPAATNLPAVSFNEVKFMKEDVTAVMAELPEFNFYEMKESAPNPYSGSTLDHSILLDPPTGTKVAPKVEFSKLENGLKIASIDRQGLQASLGLFVGTGSRFETTANLGVSHMVSLMAYKSTAHLSNLRTVKTLEQMGAHHSTTCEAGREEIVYKTSVMREFVPMVVPMLVGNVLFPRLLPWEVKAAHAKVKEARAGMATDADAMVSELLHKAAFCNNTLGHSTVASDRSMPYFTPDTIRQYMLDHCAPERMTFVGVNVNHAELSKWVMRSFADYNAIPLKKREEVKAVYTGGDIRIEGASPFCHIAIGFESVAWGQAELGAVTLLQSLLGGGNAVSNGIGAGASSRLTTQVLNQSPHVESCAAFNTTYSDSGLFGVYGVVAPNQADKYVASVAKVLKGLTTVSKEELGRAKAMLKGSLLRQADSSDVVLQDIGQQLTLSGKYGSPADFAKIIDGVSEKEVTAAAKKLLSSKVSVAAFGDTHTVPHYGAIEAALK